MSSALVLPLLAAFLVALFHAVLPDHWMPIAILARTQRWPMGRALGVAAWTGVAHIAGSLVLGAVLLALGYGLERHRFTRIAKDQDLILGTFLFATGWGLFFWKTLHGSSHDPLHEHEHEHKGHTAATRSWLTVMVAGVAASPDGAFVPVLLATLPLGTPSMTAVLITYSLTTLVSIVFLVGLATWLGLRWRWAWLDRNGERLAPLILVILGIVLVGGGLWMGSAG